MHGPSNDIIQNLEGVWIMDKTLSTEPDLFLKLQGTNWLIRKALAVATVRLYISGYTHNDPCTSLPVTGVDIVQRATGGLTGTTVKHILDWRWRDHCDYVFGSVKHRSRLVGGSLDHEGVIRPVFDLQTDIPQHPKVVAFLRGEMLEDGTRSEGFLVDAVMGESSTPEGSWLHTFAKNESAGWTAEQIWGFETVNGQRLHTRRVIVVNNKGQYVLGRLVYSPVEA